MAAIVDQMMEAALSKARILFLIPPQCTILTFTRGVNT